MESTIRDCKVKWDKWQEEKIKKGNMEKEREGKEREYYKEMEGKTLETISYGK